MNKRNYQKELDQVLDQLCTDKEETAPTLLLHSCCAPCSSYVLEYLSRYFRITVLYYNPNIYPESEYHNRVQEQMRLIRELPTRYPVDFLEGDYIPADFYHCAKGMEEIPKEKGCDYVATTLSISPLKNAEKLNEIGEELAEQYGVRWLPNDFKKRNGYKRSTELSKEYDLYRQDYCGCIFSYRERHPEASV